MLKGLFSKQKSDANPSTVEKVEKEERDSENGEMLVSVVDQAGRPVQITRAQWREQILAPTLKNIWNDSENLSAFIVKALGDKLGSDLRPASERLYEIDKNRERASCLHSRVLLACNLSKEAMEILDSAIEQFPDSVPVKTVQAEIYLYSDNHDTAIDLLDPIVKSDPNSEGPLMVWAEAMRQKEGDEVLCKNFMELGALEGSWRPLLWAARFHLLRGEIDKACELYKSVISDAVYGPDALIMISGDLGNSGALDKLVDIISPVYDPLKDSPHIGLNLLQSYLKLEKMDEGEALLSKLYSFEIPQLQQNLDFFDRKFEEYRVSRAPKKEIDPNNLKIESLVIESPLWQKGLLDANWLFSKKDPNDEVVLFLGFSKTDAASSQPKEQQEDLGGRLSRTLPLYLAESVYEWSTKSSKTLLPVLPEGGPVVFSNESDGAELSKQFKQDATYLVIGNVAESNGSIKITVSLWNTDKEEQVFTKELISDEQTLSSNILLLENELLEVLGGRCESPLDIFYATPPEEAMASYMTSISHQLSLFMRAEGYLSKDQLWGERQILDWFFRMVHQWPSAEILRFVFASSLGIARDYGSAVVSEYKRRALSVLTDSDKKRRSSGRLLPLFLKIYGEEESFSNIERVVREDKDDDYADSFKDWICRVSEL